MPGGSADPFVTLLEWLIGHPQGGDGSIEELARRCGVQVRTLRDWAAGSYPTERNSRQVQRLHHWAVGAVRGYPPPGGSGLSVVQLSGPERRVFNSGAGRVEAAAPSAQIGESARASGSTTGLGGGGSPGDVSDPDPTRTASDRGEGPPREAARGARRRRGLAAVLGSVAIAVAALIGLGTHTNWWRASSSRASTGPVTSASPAADVVTRTAVPAGATVVEYSDNKGGTTVYATPTGQSVGGLAPGKIPYRTLVRVRCMVPDQTGAPSVHALYLIASGPWQGLYGVADTFTNGDRLGAGGGHDIDPRVPDCPR